MQNTPIGLRLLTDELRLREDSQWNKTFKNTVNFGIL